MRAMWKGTVSFGLVSIPIHLYTATESKATISFRQVHASDGARVQYKRVCSAEDKEVPYGEIAKGYELDDGSMVVLTEQDLAGVAVPSSKTIEVMEFLPLEAIDPINYDKSYYMEPQKAAVKPYVLLRDALSKSGKVALVKITLRQRESIALLRVHADVLVLSTLLWPEEVRSPDFAFLNDQPQIRDQELRMAGTLIESMSEEVFDPDAYQDTYQQALREVIDAKIEGKETTSAPSEDSDTAEVVDLMSALQASVSAHRSDEETAESGKQAKQTGSKPKSSTSGSKSSSSDTAKTSRTTKSSTKTSGTSAASKSAGKAGGKSTDSDTTDDKSAGGTKSGTSRKRKSA